MSSIGACIISPLFEICVSLRVITHAPPLIPPKRGEEDERHKAVLAVYEKQTPFLFLK
jgi:hypothetical protein